MNNNILNYIILLVIILLIIVNVTPNKDSVLYILQKYINYIWYHLKKHIYKLLNYEFTDTFENTIHYNNKELDIINYIQKKNNINKNQATNLYSEIKSLVDNYDNTYFSKPSDENINYFNENELYYIKNYLLKKLNSTNFKFNNIVFESKLKYYNNIDGKQIEPFIFNLNSNLGVLRIYIDMDIRNNNIIINNINMIKDKQVIFNDKIISENNIINYN